MITWGERSTMTIDILKNRLEGFIRQNDLDYEVLHVMYGLNDGLVVKPKDVDEGEDYKYASLILVWIDGDAELAIVDTHGSTETKLNLITRDFLDFDNSKYENFEQVSEKRKYLLDNKIKYYPVPFDDWIESMFSDIVTFLSKVSQVEVA